MHQWSNPSLRLHIRPHARLHTYHSETVLQKIVPHKPPVSNKANKNLLVSDVG